MGCGWEEGRELSPFVFYGSERRDAMRESAKSLVLAGSKKVEKREDSKTGHAKIRETFRPSCR